MLHFFFFFNEGFPKRERENRSSETEWGWSGSGGIFRPASSLFSSTNDDVDWTLELWLSPNLAHYYNNITVLRPFSPRWDQSEHVTTPLLSVFMNKPSECWCRCCRCWSGWDDECCTCSGLMWLQQPAACSGRVIKHLWELYSISDYVSFTLSPLSELYSMRALLVFQISG